MKMMLSVSAALLAVTAGPALAESTPTQTFAISTPTGPTPPQTASYFDSNLGTLTGIKVSASYTQGRFYSITNTSSTAYTYNTSAGLGLDSDATGPVGLFRAVSDLNSFAGYRIDALDSLQPLQTATHIASTNTVSGSYIYNVAADFASVTRAGGESFAFTPIIDSSILVQTPAPAYSLAGGLTGIGTLSFSYLYTAAGTPGAVPEPGSWVLLMIGLGMVGASLRRRQWVNARVVFA